ncbi:7983_t:CDS:1, partial [Acaulospora colombiana]
MGPVSEAPTIQRLLPRQTLSLTSSNAPPHDSTISNPFPYKPSNAIPSWAIVTIVIGSLLILSVCGFLALHLRTRWKIKRATTNGNSLAFAKGGQNGNGIAEGGGDPKGDGTTDKGFSAPIASGNTLAEDGMKTRRRDSLLDQAE